ncbi:metabolite transport protein [Exophiala dermatitidis]
MLKQTISGHSVLQYWQRSSSNFEIAHKHPEGLMASSTTITPYLVYLAFIVTLGPFQFGYHLGELNAPQKVITCDVAQLPEYSILGLPQCIPMDSAQWGLVQSLFTIGGLFGALFSGSIAARFGRLYAMRWLSFFLAVGPIAEATANGMWAMGMGRAISGVGAGAATVVAPIYISEISPRESRGLFGAFTQVQINAGIFIAQLLGYFLSRNNTWRWILATAGFIATATLVGLAGAPETPKWLAANNRPGTAREVLQRIRSPSADIGEEMEDWDIEVDAEEQRLLEPTTEPRPPTQRTKSFLDVVSNPRYRKAVIVVSGVMMAQQLTGINSVVMYSVSILGNIMPNQAALVTVIVSAANVLVTTAAAPLADRFGRKPCLLMSLSGMGSASVMLATGLTRDVPALTVIGLVLFVCSFGFGLGPVPFMMASELVGPEAVGATSSWALACNWLSTFLVAQFFPILNDALPRGKVFWIFTALAAAFAAFVGILVPESRGRANPDEVWGRAHRS